MASATMYATLQHVALTMETAPAPRPAPTFASVGLPMAIVTSRATQNSASGMVEIASRRRSPMQLIAAVGHREQTSPAKIPTHASQPEPARVVVASVAPRARLTGCRVVAIRPA